MALAPGTKLGPYEIVAPLGAGGMGEVYRARDTRLGREVAVKVLPQHLSTNPEIRARFEREAKAVSSLNHPNVCVLHDVGASGDTDYLVMELIEGETLATRLLRGPLPLPELLKLGGQIADALDRAHRAGVIHRDLKPGNVMLTKSGAKLMDFGLARATGLGGAGSASGVTAMTTSPTMAHPLTAEGTIIGTFQYMAPEQLEGGEVDARGDIWALGCVLYEMATGRRAFEGKSQASLIGSIMHADPAPMAQLAPMSPPSLERLVRQCLAKDPTERWQSAGDVRRELEWIATGMSQGASPAPALAPRRGSGSRGLAGLAAGAVIAAAALVYAFGPWHRAATEGRLMSFEIHAPEGCTLRPNAEPALSPDGSLLVFEAFDAEGVGRLYVRSLANREARPIAGSENGVLPFWSPDGRSLAFFAKGKLYKVALDGGAPVALCDARDGRGGSWSPGGTIVFAPNNQGPIARVSANGGTPLEITKVDASRGERGHRYPQFLPDGKHFLFVAVAKQDEVVTYAASLDGGEAKPVCTAGTEARYAAPGYVLFMDQGVNRDRRRLMAQRFDAASLKVSGDPQLLVDPVSTTNFGYTNVTTDGQGTLIVQHSAPPRFRLSWFDRTGRSTGVAAEGITMMGGKLSPDGKRYAYGGREPNDLFAVDLGSGVSTRLTFENKMVNVVAWSPDGKTIAFARITSEGAWAIYTKSADGTGPDTLLFKGPGIFAFPMAWSLDGRSILARVTDAAGNYDLWKIPIGGGDPEVYEQTPAQEDRPSLSPDGRWVLYSAVNGDNTDLLVQSYPEPGTKYQLAAPGAVGAVWSPAGEIVTVDKQNVLSAVQVSVAGGFRQGSTTKLFTMGKNDRFDGVGPDGKTILVDTVMNTETMSHLEVVLNWTRMLGERE